MESRLVIPEDLTIVQKWYSQHRLYVPKLEQFPVFGSIVDEVAAGFLYRTDSTVALLDGYIANPESSASSRSRALDLITGELMKVALEQGFRTVIAFSKHQSIGKRAKAWQFDDEGDYRLFVFDMEL